MDSLEESFGERYPFMAERGLPNAMGGGLFSRTIQFLQRRAFISNLSALWMGWGVVMCLVAKEGG